MIPADSGRIDPRLIRVITMLALAVSLLLMVSLPAAYFVAARVATGARLQARSDSAALVITDFVARNPDHWGFENARIRGRLAPLVDAVDAEQWSVLDASGQMAALLGTAPVAPFLTIASPIYDSGVVVGSVVVARSVRGIVGWTAFLAVGGIVLAGASFILLRSLPLRLLAESMDRLARLTAMDQERAAQLAHASKLAQLGELATGMAHELNQPLTGITLAAQNAQRILERADPNLPSVRARLDRILQMAGRASTVIDHMRIFGRMGREKSGPISVLAALQGVRQLLAFKLQRYGVTLREELPPGLPPVFGQAVPLEQVLVNLIANACDAYGEAPPPTTPMDTSHAGREPAAEKQDRIVTVAAETADGWMHITVHDAAGGIPPDLLPRIFAPFFTTKPVGQGTGLGLSISYGIVTDLGGSLTVKSEGGTTTFTVTLKLAEAPALTAAG